MNRDDAKGAKMLPKVALSVRQPWAWLIVNGWKNVENRMWRTSFRGPFLVHASKGMTRDEYKSCQLFMDGFCSIDLPPFEDLQRGGIVGAATLLDCVDEHRSEWFCGEWGFVLAEQRVLPFHECKGSLGFFRCEYPEALLNPQSEIRNPQSPAPPDGGAGS